jgi:hypothetical protein
MAKRMATPAKPPIMARIAPATGQIWMMKPQRKRSRNYLVISVPVALIGS